MEQPTEHELETFADIVDGGIGAACAEELRSGLGAVTHECSDAGLLNLAITAIGEAHRRGFDIGAAIAGRLTP